MKIFRKILLVIIAICSVCLFASCSPNEEQPHVHEYGEWQTISDSTCNQSGLMKRSCSCGEEEEKSIPFTNEHDYQLTLEVPSDCENDGKNGYTCLVCGNYYEETVSKTGHYSATTAYVFSGYALVSSLITFSSVSTSARLSGMTSSQSLHDVNANTRASADINIFLFFINL